MNILILNRRTTVMVFYLYKEGVTHMYGALDIAKYVITKCTKDKHPISNLQLQKILYYIQRELLQQGLAGFSDDMEAWQFGPVAPAVYRQYCGFGAMPIRMQYNVKIEQDYVKLIVPIIERKRQLNPWDMVSDTHSVGKAWDIIYRNGLGDHQVIPKELIKNKG